MNNAIKDSTSLTEKANAHIKHVLIWMEHLRLLELRADA